MSERIHPTAIVERGAELGRGVQIGPYCVVGPEVTLGDGVVAFRRRARQLGGNRFGRRFQVGKIVGVVVEDVAHLLVRQQHAPAGRMSLRRLFAPRETMMKNQNLPYWIVTLLFAAAMTLSGATTLAHSPAMVAGYHHLGYPLRTVAATP